MDRGEAAHFLEAHIDSEDGTTLKILLEDDSLQLRKAWRLLIYHQVTGMTSAYRLDGSQDAYPSFDLLMWVVVCSTSLS